MRGLPHNGAIAFGSVSVIGFRRVPRPAAKIIAFIFSDFICYNNTQSAAIMLIIRELTGNACIKWQQASPSKPLTHSDLSAARDG
jgi:hypothetical protein